MAIDDYLKKELCLPALRARQKPEVLREIASTLAQHPALANVSEETLFNAFMEREELGSTGFGDGLAIPHCRLPGIDQFVVGIAVAPRGVSFEALDGRKVTLFCFLAGPENEPKTYVKVLAEISSIVRSETCRRELTKAPTRTALYEGFLRHALYEQSDPADLNYKLILMVLQGEETVTAVMELLLEMGVRGASVLESESMGKILTNVPLFANFINVLGSAQEYHRTVLTIVPEGQVKRMVASVEEITGDLDKHTGALIAALDLPLVKGTLETV